MLAVLLVLDLYSSTYAIDSVRSIKVAHVSNDRHTFDIGTEVAKVEVHVGLVERVLVRRQDDIAVSRDDLLQELKNGWPIAKHTESRHTPSFGLSSLLLVSKSAVSTRLLWISRTS